MKTSRKLENKDNDILIKKKQSYLRSSNGSSISDITSKENQDLKKQVGVLKDQLSHKEEIISDLSKQLDLTKKSLPTGDSSSDSTQQLAKEVQETKDKMKHLKDMIKQTIVNNAEFFTVNKADGGRVFGKV